MAAAVTAYIVRSLEELDSRWFPIHWDGSGLLRE
jgi:hypothetical protein